MTRINRFRLFSRTERSFGQKKEPARHFAIKLQNDKSDPFVSLNFFIDSGQCLFKLARLFWFVIMGIF